MHVVTFGPVPVTYLSAFTSYVLHLNTYSHLPLGIGNNPIQSIIGLSAKSCKVSLQDNVSNSNVVCGKHINTV